MEENSTTPHFSPGGVAWAGKAFVFGILQRFLGEPSGHRLPWARPALPETKPVSLSYDPYRRGGRGPNLPETTPSAWWRETGSKSSMNRLFINIDAQDAQDFFRRRLACVPGHPQIRTRSSPESASPAAASRPDYPVHPVHRCSIYSPSRWICPVAGGGRPARRQTGVSQRGQAGFQRSRPPDTPHLTIGTTPPGARASRPHAVPSVAAQFPCDVAADRPAGGNRMGPAEAEAGRRCRLIPVEEMAEAAGGFVRAGRPRSRVGFLP